MAVNQIQATLARMESKLIKLENDRLANNYRVDGAHYIKRILNIEKQGQATFFQEDNIDQKMEDAKEKEEKMDIADIYLTYNRTHHLPHLMNVPKEKCKSLKGLHSFDGRQTNH